MNHKMRSNSLWPVLAPVGLAFILLAGGCGQKDGIVAKVGSRSILTTEFKEEMIKRYRTEDFAAQRSLDERKEILKLMAEQKMRILDAYRLGLDKDSTVLKGADDARQQAAIQELYKVEIMDKVIPATEVRAQYDKMGEEIKASHILIKSPMDTTAEALEPVKAKADSLYKLATSGASFDSLAKQNSEDVTSAQNGGDLGYFGWGRMVDEFQEAAFTLRPGQISQPVKSSYGYHIIKLVDRRPNASRKSFEEEQENIMMNLRRKYSKELQKMAEDYLNKLKEENKLSFNYANIQKILDKVSDPSVPRNNDYFANFSEEERAWEVATVKDSSITVADLQAELVKTGQNPQWRDQKAITTMVERMTIPKFLAERAKESGLYESKSIRKVYESTLETQMAQRVEAKQVQDKMDLSDAALLAYYQSHLDEFKTDSTVEVQEIYVNKDVAADHDLAMAQRIAGRARGGENFTNLVKKYTDRKSSLPRDGRIGPITSRQYGEMGRRAFSMKINEISDPIPMGTRAYSIIKLLDKTEPHLKSFEEAKSQVERSARMKQTDSLRTAWIEEMKQRYTETIFEDRLMSALPPKAGAKDTTATTAPGVREPEMKMQQIPISKPSKQESK
jgi:parvulin-like peptidyl-prolyl isomerase